MTPRPWMMFSAVLLAAGCSQETSGLDRDAAEVAPPPDLAVSSDSAYVPSPAALCPVSTMDVLYPGALPPNPYGPAPAAGACVAAEHDAIIVLGCPNNDDGSPSACQEKRVDIAVDLRARGYGRRFIPTGAAVKNAFVEAETLRDLLAARGVPASDVWIEPRAMHTDENIYYSTRIMEAQGWASALVVSDDPGHLVMTAVCDSNCCVDLGRLTVFEFSLTPGVTKVGHYARYPWAAAVAATECQQIEQLTKAMCVNLSQRLACADDFRL